jgi:hypothetical protein
MTQRGIFLILVRHSRRERGQVPVNMRIGLLTHQRENIKPICRHCFGYRPANRVDWPLKVQLFGFCEITDRVFPMFDRRHQQPAIHNLPHRFYGILFGGGSYYNPNMLLDDVTRIGVETTDYHFTEAIAAKVTQPASAPTES